MSYSATFTPYVGSFTSPGIDTRQRGPAGSNVSSERHRQMYVCMHASINVCMYACLRACIWCMIVCVCVCVRACGRACFACVRARVLELFNIIVNVVNCHIVKPKC